MKGLFGVGLTLILLAAWAVPAGAHGGEGGDIHEQCAQPRGEPLEITVRGGVAHAEAGEVFGFDVETIRARPCQQVIVTFVNEDDVRHAFMVENLSPMFMIELRGRGERTMSFVTPDEHVTLALHCHVRGHDRAGMLGEVIVGEGGSVTGANAASAPWTHTAWMALAFFGSFTVGGVGVWSVRALRV